MLKIIPIFIMLAVIIFLVNFKFKMQINSVKRLCATPKKGRNFKDMQNTLDKSSKTMQKQLSSQFQLIRQLKRKPSIALKKQLASTFEISQFEISMPQQRQSQSSISSNQQGLNMGSQQSLSMINEENQVAIPKLLTKKITSITKKDHRDDLLEQDLITEKLYRRNSTINSSLNNQFTGKYGDNDYTKQLMNQKSDSHCQKPNNHMSESMDNDRFQQDYQVMANDYHNHLKHHENYLCLNKLDRIFYYVKKVNFTQDHPQSQVLDLCHMQILLANRDEDNLLLRIYQNWIQQDAIYMVFQLADTSLQDLNTYKIKLKQYQVWNLLNDIGKSFQYLKNQECNHLNIKPGNILRCRNSYKLSDPYCTISNMHKILTNEFSQEQIEKNRYLSPEIIKYYKYLEGINAQKSDVYSLGICLLENLLGPIIHILQYKELKKQVDKSLKFFSHAIKKLLLRMVSPNPNKRPNYRELFKIQQDLNISHSHLNLKKNSSAIF